MLYVCMYVCTYVNLLRFRSFLPSHAQVVVCATTPRSGKHMIEKQNLSLQPCPPLPRFNSSNRADLADATTMGGWFCCTGNYHNSQSCPVENKPMPASTNNRCNLTGDEGPRSNNKRGLSKSCERSSKHQKAHHSTDYPAHMRTECISYWYEQTATV